MAANPDIYRWRFGKKYCRVTSRLRGACFVNYDFIDGTTCLSVVFVRKAHNGIRYWESTGEKAGRFEWCY